MGWKLQKSKQEEHESGCESDVFHANAWTKKYVWQEKMGARYKCDYSDDYLQRVFGNIEQNCEACREDWRNIGKNQILLRNEIMEKQGLFDDSMTAGSEDLEKSQTEIEAAEELPINLDLTDDDVADDGFSLTVTQSARPEESTVAEAVTLMNQSMLSISDSELGEAEGKDVIHSLSSDDELDQVPSRASSITGESDDTESADVEEIQPPISASSPRKKQKTLNVLVMQKPQANVRVAVENEKVKPNIVVEIDNSVIEDHLELDTGPAEDPVDVELSHPETQTKTVTTVLVGDEATGTKKKMMSVVETVTKRLTTTNKVGPSDLMGQMLSDVSDESLHFLE